MFGVPAKAGTPASAAREADKWVPAFAGTRTQKLCAGFLGHAEEPRPGGARLLLVGGDLGPLLLGQADIVEAVEQAMLAERIDVEMHDFAVRARNRLFVEIDRQHGIAALLGIVHQL